MPVSETLSSFLDRKRVTGSDKFTHTSMGLTPRDIGKYYIGDDDLDTFYDLYTDHVDVQRNKIWMIEAPTTVGPMRVDLDFTYDGSVKTNQHTRDQIVDFTRKYVEAIRMFVLTPAEFDVYVTEKKRPVERKDGSVAGGVHLLVPGIRTNRYVEMAVRDVMLTEMEGIFGDLPLKDKNWDKVYDSAIAKRSCGWTMYGSSKPGGGLPYLVSGVLHCAGTTTAYNGETNDVSVDILRSFCTRVTDIDTEAKYTLVGEERFRELPETSDSVRVSGGAGVKPTRGRPIERKEHGSRENSPSAQMVLRPLSEEEREFIQRHVMNLNPERARPHNERYMVIQVLKNIHPDLYDVFEDFFRQIPAEFSVSKCISQWNEAKYRNDGQRMEIGTLLFWSRLDNPDQYKEIQESNILRKIDGSLAGTEYDVASVVYAKFSDIYKCVSFGKNVWFKFMGHVWHELDRGVQLQQELSTEVWKIYKKRAGFYGAQLIDGSIPMCNAKDRAECGCEFCEISTKEESLNKICTKLKTTKFKENVMKECRELFLDEEFIKKVDENRQLLACSNGVFDMKTLKFRDGKQEDYLSFSTGLDVDPDLHYTAYPAWPEVKKFIEQVLPNETVRNYFTIHLSRCLDGVGNQRFHILTGTGSNGKSMLMNLVETALGDYACKVPISLITQGRNKSSSASPEVVRLKGRRFVTMQEPDEAVPLNTGIMKELTSSEKLLCRDLYAGAKSMIEFELQCKMHLACNDKPKVNSNDGGTWRRLIVINFLSKFVASPVGPTQFRLDTSIEHKVKSTSWGRAFLAYLIHLYKENSGKEVVPPEVVLEYTSEYREENDAITKFIRESLRSPVDGEVVVPVRREILTDTFKQWWETNRGTRDWRIQEMMKSVEVAFGQYVRGGWKTFQIVQDEA